MRAAAHLYSMKNGCVIAPQMFFTSSLQSASACSRLQASCRHQVPRFAMSAGVSQYMIFEHSSHHVQADVSLHGPQVQVLAEQLRDCVFEPQVGQATSWV